MGRPCANLKKPSQFGLFSATREHEVGIASNRGSACRGEYVLRPCTHRPSHHGNWLRPKHQTKDHPLFQCSMPLLSVVYQSNWWFNVGYQGGAPLTEVKS